MSGAFLMTVRCYLLFRRADTPYQAVFGRTPVTMKDFEPAIETMIGDLSGGAPGHSRHHMRVR